MGDKSFKVTCFDEQRLAIYRDLEVKKRVIGREICPTTEKVHWQIYLCFQQAQRVSTLRKKLKPDHVEVAIQKNWNYEIMEGDYTIEDFSQQGERNDLTGAITKLKQEGIQKMIEDYPREYVKFHGGLEKLSFRLQGKRNFKPLVKWIWGPTGTGKTKMVHDEEPDLYVCPDDNRWWDGYEGQEAVLIDDFRADWCKFHTLLKILDRYEYKVQIKGGFRQLVSKRMYITCPYPPEEVYQTREDIGQLLRRIDEVISKNLF